ncbi:uncharacterized protein TM35_000311490 [Trypanosoma theileri]|uniref:Uncharacterized protein n=1 Tax=Trypanosoma theileri TaxID=67003 RepID=A0A1X0NN88_9TRYP|nr:uncharacterized protein TM35_000311490 [Trypanosoma theileri]ORC85963.1 hypothetical protein TM35_000311490 [Trypanosoma theileri]
MWGRWVELGFWRSWLAQRSQRVALRFWLGLEGARAVVIPPVPPHASTIKGRGLSVGKRKTKKQQTQNFQELEGIKEERGVALGAIKRWGNNVKGIVLTKGVPHTPRTSRGNRKGQGKK